VNESRPDGSLLNSASDFHTVAKMDPANHEVLDQIRHEFIVRPTRSLNGINLTLLLLNSFPTLPNLPIAVCHLKYGRLSLPIYPNTTSGPGSSFPLSIATLHDGIYSVLLTSTLATIPIRKSVSIVVSISSIGSRRTLALQSL